MKTSGSKPSTFNGGFFYCPANRLPHEHFTTTGVPFALDIRLPFTPNISRHFAARQNAAPMPRPGETGMPEMFPFSHSKNGRSKGKSCPITKQNCKSRLDLHKSNLNLHKSRLDLHKSSLDLYFFYGLGNFSPRIGPLGDSYSSGLDSSCQ